VSKGTAADSQQTVLVEQAGRIKNPTESRRTQGNSAKMPDSDILEARADLENVREIVQEFSQVRYPRKSCGVPAQAGTPSSKPKNGVNDTLKQVVDVHVASLETSGKLTEADIPRLRADWIQSCQDIMKGVPEALPPFRVVNHHIPLIDENKQYNYHLPRCADGFKPELLAKIKRYQDAGWWEPCQVGQAAPMLCIPKPKTGLLRTPIDCRKRNDNTVKDVTPFPDQDQIRLDVAGAKVRSKIDFSDAYEQVRVAPEDVYKTAFATIFGTFLSYVMQIGDCNAPATFQRIMTAIFRDYIGIFLHVYLDDLFVFSNSIDEHEEHLKLVFARIREHQFYLKTEKCDLYAETVDCLGHMIDHRGLHADHDKMVRIRDW
jgi:hypothetical protein